MSYDRRKYENRIAYILIHVRQLERRSGPAPAGLGGGAAGLRTSAPARVVRIGPMPCGHGALHTGTAGVGRADEHTPTHPLAAVSRVR